MNSQQIVTVNPATGNDLNSYHPYSEEKIFDILGRVRCAQECWSQSDVKERATFLSQIAAKLRSERSVLAELIVSEMGKPIGEALAEVDKCALTFDFYAEEGPAFLSHKVVATSAQRSWVAYEPAGVILAVMPWNFPLWQVARFAAPVLLAGNGGILKHSPNVTGIALTIEKVFLAAGLPMDLFRTILVVEPEVPRVTAALLADDRIAGVSLTGSEGAGAAVAALAGGQIKKSLLELGGSDAFIVMSDADLDMAAEFAVKSRFFNNGQSCLSAKRFIVDNKVYDDFLDRFANIVSALKVGDPMDISSQLGPLARRDLVVNIERQVNDSLEKGASIILGGRPIAGDGFWFSPTIMTNVSLDMPVMKEETFGPVAAVIGFDDEAEIAPLANASRYGLGGSIWSKDTDKALSIGKRISSGALFINALVASDPRLSFGGVKRSGYGRELGELGAREFTNPRTYFIGA